MTLRLYSPAFTDGEAVPKRFTCDGENVSPTLEWEGTPQGTRSLALVCSDPDAPAGTWYHWALFDIPADSKGLPEVFATDARVGAVHQAVNDFGRTGYGGPCPPPGHGTHRYVFHLTALAVERLDMPSPPGCRDVEDAVRRQGIDEAVLTGTYAR